MKIIGKAENGHVDHNIAVTKLAPYFFFTFFFFFFLTNWKGTLGWNSLTNFHNSNKKMLLLPSPPSSYPSSSSLPPISDSKCLPIFHLPTTLSPRRIFHIRSFATNRTTALDSFTQRSGYLFDLTAYESESLAEYSASKIAAIYRRKPLLVLRRLLQVGSTFGRWFGLRLIDDLRERSDLMFEVRSIFLSFFFFFAGSYLLFNLHICICCGL